jgi:uncharacterized damage-inducible protein DinB
MTSTSDVVRTMFEHHFWATGTLLDHLERSPAERLDEEIAGTYGPILKTLTHLVDADDRYLQRMAGIPWTPYVDRGAVPLETLRADLADHEVRWRQFLEQLEAGTLRAEIRGRDGNPDIIDAEGVLLLQAIQHGNDHRTHICSTLGALGEDVPDLDGWTYWAEGRS